MRNINDIKFRGFSPSENGKTKIVVDGKEVRGASIAPNLRMSIL